jgi:hypothetical protein
MNSRRNPSVIYGFCVLVGTVIGFLVSKDNFWIGSVIGIAVGFFIMTIMRGEKTRNKDS